MSLNPYLAKVRARTANRETWKAAPAWVRRQSIHGAWMDSSRAYNAVGLESVARQRRQGQIRLARWYLEAIKEGRKDSTWESWYKWGFDGLPWPRDLAERGIEE